MISYHDIGAYVKDTLVHLPATAGRRWTTECLTPVIAAMVLLLPIQGDGSRHGGCLVLVNSSHTGLPVSISVPKIGCAAVKASYYDAQRSMHGMGLVIVMLHVFIVSLVVSYQETIIMECYDCEENGRLFAPVLQTMESQRSFTHRIDTVSIKSYFSQLFSVKSYLLFGICVSFKKYRHPSRKEL